MWAVLLLVGLLGLCVWELWGKRRGLPPGPMPLPIVGNALSMDPNDVEAFVLGLRRKYGHTFTWWLGGVPQVHMCEYAKVKELFTSPKTADAFTGRPALYTFEVFAGMANTGFVLSTGDKWRETRRFSMHVLRDFGVGKSLLEDSIRHEGDAMIAYFKELLDGEAKNNLDPTEPLSVCIINIISRIIFGYAYARDDAMLAELRRIIARVIKTLGRPEGMLLMVNPWLRHVPVLGHFGRDQLARDGKAFYGFIQQELDKVHADFDAENDARCFADAYWKEMEERRAAGNYVGHLDAYQLCTTVGDIWTAGFETTVTTLRWALVFLTLEPEAQAKVHEELDAFYADNPDGPVTMEHRLSLPYTQGAINEVQRMANIIPLNVQHATTRDVEVDGYRFPKGTVVVPNFGAILKDPSVFESPEEFRPERFVDGARPARVEEFMPFSLGKRMCAGEPLAKMELFILFTMLLRRFRFSVSPSHGPPSRERVEGMVSKPRPFTLTVHDRFPGL